jgi:Cu-Zn family superoxide dismutase
MPRNLLWTTLVLAAALAGCGDGRNAERIQKEAEQAIAQAQERTEQAMAQAERKVREAMAERGYLEEDIPRRAVAVLHPTAGNDVSGTVVFTPADRGLRIATRAEGLTPGEHGYHIHLYGDCTAVDGTSAGTHFNLEGSSLNPPEDIDRITGDLGDLQAGDDGVARHEAVIENASLAGPKSIVGRAVIVHEKPNDPSQPPIGAAGARQACGVIGVANPE